jgi:DNA ligase 1
MDEFAELLKALTFSPSRNRKIALLSNYFENAPEGDRGFAFAALTGRLSFKAVKSGLFRSLAAEKLDPVLFELSYDFVGDLAETISLIWPGETARSTPSLKDVVNLLSNISRSDAPYLLSGLLDALGPSSRYALIKLATGGLRVGVSQGLVRSALAKWSGKAEAEIEDSWHAGEPPYGAFFNWLIGQGEKPASSTVPRWRSFMLAHPATLEELSKFNPEDFLAEWKWDGIRVQVVADGDATTLYSRTGEDITGSFPELQMPSGFIGVIDGELLARRTDVEALAPGTFNDLQQRLNRKAPPQKLIDASPVFIRSYDVLQVGVRDVRAEASTERRRTLLDVIEAIRPDFMDVSEVVRFESFESLDKMRRLPPDPAIEGVMLKRKDAAYVSGRTAGLWFKWKKAPMTADVVLMYAQRGHGKRSGLYSDFTFGAWTDDGSALLPVGKAYFGFTDKELAFIDRYVRENTIDRFGPVRSIKADAEQGLVFELEFEGIGLSGRHKSGIALRFPRISRIRQDKPPREADTIASMKKLIV